MISVDTRYRIIELSSDLIPFQTYLYSNISNIYIYIYRNARKIDWQIYDLLILETSEISYFMFSANRFSQQIFTT